MNIFLDMDGPLCDLDKAVLELTGRPYKENDPVELWKMIDEIPDFFFTLDKAPGADELVDGVMTIAKNVGATVEILTALPYRTKIGPAVKYHKKRWVNDRYGSYGEIPFNVGPFSMDKWQHCRGPRDVLIDDSVMNIADWQKAGGIAIHHVNHVESLRRLMQAVSI